MWFLCFCWWKQLQPNVAQFWDWLTVSRQLYFFFKTYTIVTKYDTATQMIGTQANSGQWWIQMIEIVVWILVMGILVDEIINWFYGCCFFEDEKTFNWPSIRSSSFWIEKLVSRSNSFVKVAMISDAINDSTIEVNQLLCFCRDTVLPAWFYVKKKLQLELKQTIFFCNR